MYNGTIYKNKHITNLWCTVYLKSRQSYHCFYYYGTQRFITLSTNSTLDPTLMQFEASRLFSDTFK
jgi:hypothetical protein